MTSRRRWWAAGLGVLALSVVLEIFFPDVEHAEFFWHRIPGFDALYGFAGCAFIALGAKGLGKMFLQKPETYYEKEPR